MTLDARTEAKPTAGRKPRVTRVKVSDRELVYIPHELDDLPQGLPECYAFDLETTGVRGWAFGERIIEVGAVRYDAAGNELASIERLIRIGPLTIPPVVSALTHITDEMLRAGGHAIEDALDELSAFFGPQPLVIGHNLNFDLVFLVDAYEALGRTAPRFHGFCTLAAARRIFPDAADQKLSTVVKEMGIELVDAHRAGADARADYDAARRLVTRFNARPVPKGIIYRSELPDPLRATLRGEIDRYVQRRSADEGWPAWRVLTQRAREDIVQRVPPDRAAVDHVAGITATQAAREGDALWEIVERTRRAA